MNSILIFFSFYKDSKKFLYWKICDLTVKSYQADKIEILILIKWRSSANSDDSVEGFQDEKKKKKIWSRNSIQEIFTQKYKKIQYPHFFKICS